MTEPTTTANDPLVESLAESGAAPVEVDASALLAQIQALQARVDSLSVAQGVPADPLAAAVKDLKDHVNAGKNAHPAFDYGELPECVANLSDAPSKEETEYLKAVCDEITYVEGLDYVKKLANNLHKLVLKS